MRHIETGERGKLRGRVSEKKKTQKAKEIIKKDRESKKKGGVGTLTVCIVSVMNHLEGVGVIVAVGDNCWREDEERRRLIVRIVVVAN